ncbi:MAG: DUF1849 family protein [Pseudomonadota bacterium]
MVDAGQRGFMQMAGKYGRVLLALAAAGVYGMSAACAAVPEPGLAPHKALYDFRLVEAETGAGISSIKGKIYFEQDDVCDAWTTNHRFTTEYRYSDAPAVVNTSRYAAFEAKDQGRFSFDSERQENGERTEQLRGSVEISKEGAAKAVYSRPDGLAYDLSKNYFLPTAHTMEIIRHARAGDRFFSAVLFDGTDADGPVEIGAFIGKKTSADEMKKISGEGEKIDASLLTPDAWHVRMAVFPLKDAGEIEPSYEMDMIMHDNGVVSHALIGYKTFKVEQTLTALEKLPPKKCN